MVTENMDHRAAWRDFVQNVLPDIRNGLSRKQRQAIDLAERDFYGKRLKKSGAPYGLGYDRVQKLLDELAPGRYEVEVRVWFRRVG